MRHIILLTVLVIAGSAIKNNAHEQKNQVAGGRGYSNQNYGHIPVASRPKKKPPPSLVDDFVCDIDASILIVTEVKQAQPETIQPPVPEYGAPQPPAPKFGAPQPPNPEYGAPQPPAPAPTFQQQGYPNPPQPQPFQPPVAGFRSKRQAFNQGYPQQLPVGPQLPTQYGQPQQVFTQPGGYPINQPQQQPYGSNPYEPQPNYQPPPPLPEPNAERLRCSGIAYTSLEDCKTCCRLAARQDQSFSKQEVLGFLIDFNQLDFDGDSPFPTLSSPPEDSDVIPPEPRCVCCAPKRKVYRQ